MRAFLVLIFWIFSTTLVYVYLLYSNLVHNFRINYRESKDVPEADRKTSGCSFPAVDPFDKAIENITRKFPTIDCSKKKPHLVYTKGDTAFINHTKIKELPWLKSTFKHCCYEIRVRDPNQNEDQKTITFQKGPCFKDSVRVTAEYVLVKCYNTSNIVISKSYLTFIRRKPELEAELKIKYTAHVNQHAPKETLSVMMVGVDGMSRNSMIRSMPKTRRILLETMKAVELHKHNKYADNTLPNVFGLLTGNSEGSMLRVNWTRSQSFDKINDFFLWSTYRNAGYRTAMFVDRSRITSFHNKKRGWVKQPVDYYFREAVVDFDNDMMRSGFCIGDVPDITLLTDYWVKFATLFNNSKTEPYFTYSFSAHLTHDDVDMASAGDELYYRFLTKLVDGNLLNNTVLVFFSDHGPRFGAIRSTYNGMVEARTPYMFLVFPSWFHTKYPQLMEVVKTNQERLTTHTDVYETLIDLLYFKAETGKGSLTQPRFSLFKEIPEGRTCEHAQIAVECCACMDFTEAKLSKAFAQFLGLALVEKVNRYIPKQLKNNCLSLQLNQVTTLIDISSNISQKKQYQVTVTTLPNDAIYEGVVGVTRSNKAVVTGDVIRLNMYKHQADCIEEEKLRQYCYCKPTKSKLH
ncbi:uncharacterized protein LOC131937601 [Physella acuta]|uniref:uncharacterized protein LOC131937601 n=1 Tax=Physella acuta TaxID=109671 RepID=UPI0027DBC609|nr:uncharacterized protein LOC131937601 [Physella acuta]